MKQVDVLKERLELLKRYEPDSEEIVELENQIKLSKKAKSSRRKGASYESKVSKRIAEADDFVFLRLKDFLDILDDGKIIKKCLDKKTKM